jgi:hypothetical protein
VWWWGEEKTKIKRKGNEGGLGGEKSFGGIFEPSFLEGPCHVYFF